MGLRHYVTVARSEMTDRHGDRTVRVARMGVAGNLLSTALLCLVGILYIAVLPVRSWGAGIAVVLVLVGVIADVALRRTWRRVEGEGRNPARRERLKRAADVAGMSPERVASADWALTALWLVIVVIAFFAARHSF